MMEREIPSELKREIDRICLGFESACRSGSQLNLNLEDYEDSAVASGVEQLRKELQRLASQLAHGQLSDTPRSEIASTRGLGPADRMPGLHQGSEDEGLAYESSRILGDYSLIREIGRGGQAVVHEARQLSLDRRVAIKVLPFARVLNPSGLQRFKNEAKAAAQLRHPNILPVHAFGSQNGTHYYVMDYIGGGTVADLVQEIRQRSTAASKPGSHFAQHKGGSEGSGKSSSVGSDTKVSQKFIETVSTSGALARREYYCRVAEVGLQVAEALQYAHENGVIHRDIKPSNLLLDDEGKPWIADFGLAQLETDPDLTKPGDFLGTLRYMSPEQGYANRVTLDGRTDIFSLGATLYELLTLKPVFDGETRAEILRQVAFQEPTSPTKLDRRIPKDLETIVMKCLEKKPDARYDTAQQLADDLRAWLQHKRITARPPSVPQRVRKWAGKHKVLVTSTTAILVTAVTVAIAGLAVALEAQKQQTDELAGLLRQSEGMRLVAHSSLEKPRNPGLAVALAKEGARLHSSSEANHALLEALDANREHRVLRRHNSPVGTARYSPDGRKIVTTAPPYWYKFSPEPALLWDGESGDYLAQLSEDWPITSAAFSPSGERILTSSSPASWHHETGDELARRPPAVWDARQAVKIGQLQGAFLLEALPTAFRTVGKKTEIVAPAVEDTARIYNASGDEERVLRGHDRRVTFAGFSPGGRQVVTASDDNTVRVWDANTGEETQKLDYWRQQCPQETHCLVDSAVFSSDERLLLTVSPKLGVHLWDLDRGQQTSLGDGDLAVFSPDGEMIAVARWGTVRVLDVPTRDVLCELADHERAIRHLEFSSDSRLLVTSTLENMFRAWEAATGELAAEFRGHRESVRFASFAPDGRRIVSGADDQTARIWNLQSGAEQAYFPTRIDSHQSRVSFRPDGRQALLVSEHEWRTAVWNLDDLEEPLYSVEGRPRLPDEAEQRFVTCSEHQVAVRDFRSGVESAVMRFHGQPLGKAKLSRDGSRVLVLVRGGPPWLWTIDNDRKVRLGRQDSRVSTGMFHPDGNQIATGAADATVYIWDGQSGVQIKELPHDRPVSCVKYSADGTRLLTVTNRHKAHVWDTTNFERLCTFEAPSRINEGVISTDGKYAFTYHVIRGESIFCWDAANGELVNTLPDVEGRVEVQVSPAKSQAVIASDQAGLIWWDFAGGQTRKLSENPTAVAMFTADGRRIASSTAQPKSDYDLSHQAETGLTQPLLQVWDVAEGKLEREALVRNGAAGWMQLAPESGTLIAELRSHPARVFNVRERHEVAVLQGHAAPICFARFRPDRRTAVTCSWDQTVVLWDIEQQRPVEVLTGHQAAIKAAAISADGNLLATGDDDGVVILWDLEERELLRRLEGLSAPVGGCSFSAFGARVVAFSDDGAMRIWRTATGGPVDLQRYAGAKVSWAEYGVEGSTLLIVYRKPGDRQKTVELVPAEGQAAIELPHEGTVKSARLGLRGRHVLTIMSGRGDGPSSDRAFVWDADSGARLHTVGAPGASIRQAAVNSAGTLLMTHQRTTISVRDLVRQVQVLELNSELDFYVPRSAEYFSPDGAVLLAISPDRRVRTIAIDQIAEAQASRSLSENERARFQVHTTD